MREELIDKCYWCGEEDKLFVKRYTDTNTFSVQCAVCEMEFLTDFETTWETVNSYNKLMREGEKQ